MKITPLGKAIMVLLGLTIIYFGVRNFGADIRNWATGGKEAALEHVATRIRLSRVEIRAEKPLTLNLDGEPVEARHFRIECVPRRVRMHLPADCPLLSRSTS